MVKTDAVVCARGERAKTIVPVVRALRKGAGGQVILVDDGGNTGLWRARLAGARVRTGPQRGKAAAMRLGLFYVGTPRVVFADADIVGFTPCHAAALTRDNDGQVAGLRDNGSWWLGPFPPVTGERCLPVPAARRALFGCEGYSAETAINAECGARGLPVRTVVMRGCVNPSKEPLRRTGQVLRAAARYAVGLMQYAVAWLVTAFSSLG